MHGDEYGYSLWCGGGELTALCDCAELTALHHSCERTELGIPHCVPHTTLLRLLLANRPHFTHLFIAHRRISCVRFDSLLESYLCLQLSISRRVGELESFEECAFALLRGQVSQVLTNGVLLARRRLEHLFLSHSLLVHLREARARPPTKSAKISERKCGESAVC